MSQIDLSQLPPPEIVQQIDAEQIHSAMLARFQQLMPDMDVKVGDPIYNAFLAQAQREVTVRQEFQDNSLQNMVAYATGSNLQHLAAWRPVEKQAGESDDRLRQRVQLAPEGFSVAGPKKSYISLALKADVRVKDVVPVSPSPGVSHVYVLSTEGDGVPDSELLQIVGQALDPETSRPWDESLLVFPASVQTYSIDADLILPDGPGVAQILADAESRLQAYVDEAHRLGEAPAESAMKAALHLPGVRKVVINSPATELQIAATEAAYCSGITLRRADG